MNEAPTPSAFLRGGIWLALIVAASCSRGEEPAGGDRAGGETRETAYEQVFGPGPVGLLLRLDQTEIGLADQIRLEEELRMDPGFEADFPEYLPEDFEGFAVVDSFPLDPRATEEDASVDDEPDATEGDGDRVDDAADATAAQDTAAQPRVRRQCLVLEPNRSGELKIAPLEVFYRRTGEEKESFFRTDEISIQVEPLSNVDELEVKDPRDILAAPPAAPDQTWIYWAAGGLGGVLAFALLLWALFLRRGGVRILPSRPPHEIAWESLRQLISLQLVEKGQIERFYVYLSGILRIYIESRFQVRAPELTTEEFFVAAQSSPELGPYRARLKEFLDLCDQVKFARFEPEPSTIQSSFDVVKMFIQETTPHES